MNMNDEKTKTVTYVKDGEAPFPVTINKEAVAHHIVGLRDVKSLDTLIAIFALWQHNLEHTMDVYRAVTSIHAHDYLMADIVEATARCDAIVQIVADRSPEDITRFLNTALGR